MTNKFNPLPAPGDFVWCHFPQEIGNPGPKARPALVVAVSPTDHAVEIAYGTSKKTERIYPGEFLLDPSDVGFDDSGLACATKFDFNNCLKLPFDSDWFAVNKGVYASIPLPKIGVLHPSYVHEAHKAYSLKKN